jgi:hypothetical protein
MRFLSFSNKKKNSGKKIRTRSVERSVRLTGAKNALRFDIFFLVNGLMEYDSSGFKRNKKHSTNF